MNVLQVNNTDLPGKRFNGFDLMNSLVDLGIDCRMAVLDKLSFDSRVYSLTEGWADERLRARVH